MIKMNRILLACFLFFYSTAFSYQKENPFNNSEDQIYAKTPKNENQFAIAEYENYDDAYYLTNGTGPPGDDDATVPIDDYIPLLLIVAFVMIGYIGTKKQTLET